MTVWRPWQILLLGIFLGLLSSAVVLLVAMQPRGSPVELGPIPTESPLVVSVVGAIQTPGVYTLPPGSRVKDAVKAAGGLSVLANTEALNLAGLLRDGQQVFVPSRAGPSSTMPPSERTGLVDINTASLQDLMTLPGIGETRAQDILTYRQQNGGFTQIEELMNINGIGQSTFEKLKIYITIVK
jgi:competence protein ComEA